MNGIDEHINMYGGLLPPLSRTITETFPPVYGTSVADSFPTKPLQLHTDSGLMHTLPVSRKRSRGDSIYQYQQFQNHLNNVSFFGEDISLLIQHQKFEIENFITQHVSITLVTINKSTYTGHVFTKIILKQCEKKILQ